jgi:hypothetical protein
VAASPRLLKRVIRRCMLVSINVVSYAMSTNCPVSHQWHPQNPHNQRVSERPSPVLFTLTPILKLQLIGSAPGDTAAAAPSPGSRCPGVK